jgi:hypothetical protein
MAISDVAADAVSHSGLFAEAQAAAATEATEVTDGVDSFAATATATAASGRSSVLADAFDDVAAAAPVARTATDMPTVAGESQMTGGGPPLAPGIRTMSAEPVSPVDPTDDDALGVPVAASAVPLAAVMTAADVDQPSVGGVVGVDGLDDSLDAFDPVAGSVLSDLPGVADPMADVAEDLPVGDSPNPLDDLDDPLDPL